MKKQIFKSLTILLIGLVPAFTIFFFSCKNKLNILAPYKELVSVYAILNPQEQYQYIRINKVYAGEGNAYQMAQVNDSINFPAGQLQVSLKRKLYGGYSPVSSASSNTELFLRDTLLTTASGTFNNQQRFYYTTQPLYPSGTFELYIKDLKTGATFTSSTAMIDSVKPVYQPLAGPYYPLSPYAPSADYIDLTYPSINTTRYVNFFTNPNAYVYELTIRMFYADSLVGGSVVNKHVDNTFAQVFANDLNGGTTMKLDYLPSALFNGYYTKILNTDNGSNILFRKLIKIDYIIYAGSYDYYTFLQSNTPSSSIAQDKPIFSNISNGAVGVFAARSRIHVSKHPSNGFKDYLATTKPYCNLRFLRYDGSISSICN